MRKVIAIRPELDAHLWKIQFADSVIKMCPEMNPDAADEASDTEVLRAARLDPVAAARLWVARKFGPLKEVR